MTTNIKALEAIAAIPSESTEEAAPQVATETAGARCHTKPNQSSQSA